MGEQLLMNYCYGHPDSSLLLFPYSPTVNFINHGTTLGENGSDVKSGSDANVYLRWSREPPHRFDWLKRTARNIVREERHAGLVLEIAPLRDIAAGEEILLDYGRDWERAWSDHAESWYPPVDTEYVSASMLNNRGSEIGGGPVRTEEEQIQRPYPRNVDILCYVPPDVECPTEKRCGWRNTLGIFDFADYAKPCRILDRQIWEGGGNGGVNSTSPSPLSSSSTTSSRDLYVANVTVGRDDNSGHGPTSHTWEGIPRKAIEFVDRGYTKDQFLSSAFRHEIGLPEGTFPEAWMDLRQK